MTYFLYHIPGKKIGITKNLKKRVEEQQGYQTHEYDIILSTDDINIISEAEISLQKAYGYRVDETPYNELKFNTKEMNINITEATTTFPCPANKLKGRLMDNMGMTWETEHGECIITPASLKWIISNMQTSRYNDQRSYIYNKAFSRWFENNDPYISHDVLGGNLQDAHMKDQYNGKCRSGALSPTGVRQEKCNDCDCVTQFDLIRNWADNRGLYEHGDPKTQSLKLVEEVGEICRAVLKDDIDEVIDGIGDAVVVLTNLAELHDVSIEECIASAYGVISKRTGKMVNGTFKKD